MILVFIGIILWSSIMAFNVPESQLTNVVHTALQKPPLRGLMSTVLFVLSPAVLLVAFFGVRSKVDVVKILHITSIALVTVVVLSFIQAISYWLIPAFDSVWNFFSMQDLGVDLSSELLLLGYRPSLFSQEPKYFGVLIGNAIAFNVLFILYPIYGLHKWVSAKILLIPLCFLLMSSASISAIVSSFLGILFIIGHYIFFQLKKTRHIFRVFLLAIILIVLIIFIFGNSEFVQDRFLLYRVMSNIDYSSAYAELSTTAYIMWMFDKYYHFILGVGLGNGAYYAFEYISYLSSFFEYGFVSARLPILDLLSGVGVIGVALIYWIWFRWIKLLSVEVNSQNNINKFIVGFIVYQIAVGLIVEVYPFIWFLFGVGFALALSKKTNHMNNKMYSITN